MELYKEGRDDLAISEMLGCKKSAFAQWRRDRYLPAHKQKGAAKKNSPRPKKAAQPAKGVRGVMCVSQLVRLLSVVEAGHPDAIVSLENRCITGVDVFLRMDATGAAMEKRVILKLEEK